MKLRRLAWAVPVLVSLLALVPATSAAAPTHVASATTAAAVPAPVHGKVTNCTSIYVCAFAFNTYKGTGWANASWVSGSTEKLAIQLPGEAKASYGLPYSTYIALLTGTYTYWTVGSFVGTDQNSGNVIYGTTNTNYTITCHGHSGKGGGCTYTYTTDNGTIVVKFTNAEQTTTAISCSPTTVSVGAKTSCSVTVTNTWSSSKVPTGTVRIYDGRLGSLSNKGTCTLTSGSCTFKFTPYDTTCGSATLLASYVGTSSFYKSSGSVTVTVTNGC